LSKTTSLSISKNRFMMNKSMKEIWKEKNTIILIPPLGLLGVKGNLRLTCQ
jgi:hypothetical protein